MNSTRKLILAIILAASAVAGALLAGAVPADSYCSPESVAARAADIAYESGRPAPSSERACQR